MKCENFTLLKQQNTRKTWSKLSTTRYVVLGINKFTCDFFGKENEAQEKYTCTSYSLAISGGFLLLWHYDNDV